MADYNLKAVITGDASGYEAAVSKAKKASDTLSSSIGQISKLMTTAFSVVGISASISSITKFGNECVKSAESANKSLSILNNTLKVTGATAWTTSEDMVKMSEDIAYSTNYTVGEIQDMQSVLLGFKNITGDTFRDASDAITDMATVMGMDLKSAVQTVGKALDDPIKGLDSLKRQGFAFTDEQKEQMKVLVESGKIIEAQKLILDELNTTYGGAATAAQSSFDKQKDAITKFKETLGNQLLPVLDTFSEKSANAFDGLTDKIQTVDFTSIAADIEYSVQLIKEYLKVFYENIKELFRGITEQLDGATFNVETFKQNIYNVLNTIYKQMQLSFGFMKSLINGDWKLAWEYAKLFVLEASKKIVDELNNLMKKIPDIVNGAIKGLNAYYEAQDKVLIEWLHLPEKWVKAPRLGTYDGENFIDTSKLQSQIDEATRIIEEATGKQVTVNLTGLEQIDENRKKYSKKAESEEIRLTSTTTTQVEKRENVSEIFFNTLKAQFADYIKKIQKDADDWSGVFSTIHNTLQDAFGQTFILLGENLTGAGHGFEDFASIALNALADVLKSLGAQLAAISAVKALSYSYGEAIVAASASAAAFAASGVASSISESLSTTKDRIDAVGEAANKSGKDLEYFKKRLSEIQSGLTASSRNLLSNIADLRMTYKEAVKAKNEAYDAYSEALNNKQYNYRMDFSLTLTRESVERINSTKSAYESLKSAAWDAYKSMHDASHAVLTTIQDEITENNKLIQSYKDIYSASDNLKKLEEAYNRMSEAQKKSLQRDYIASNFAGGNITKNLLFQLEEYRNYVNILLNEQKVNVQKLLTDVYDQLANTGKTIGENLVNSILNGAEKSDFLSDMKTYIRENLIKIAVYTETFQNKLAEVGVKLSTALSEGFTEEGIKSVKEELENLYESAMSNSQRAEGVISAVFGSVSEVTKETQQYGETIGKTFITSILNGATEKDFLLTMKDYIRENLVKLAVYTESFQARLSAIGEKLSEALISGSGLPEIRKELEVLYKEGSSSAKRAESLISEAFGDLQENVDNSIDDTNESIDKVEERLSTFEQAMKRFKDTISDLGGDIASNFVDAISNGLNQSDFLDSMKKWIKKMLVQSVVYTESMKAEIEAIGQAITKGLSEGFTETTFHEIRRDLSWVFDQANQTISGIDNILNNVFGGGYATGTQNATSGLHLVGEAGPELVRFNGGERVYNANDTKNMLSGVKGGNTFNVTFNNTQDTTAFAMMQQLRSYNRELAFNGIL